jgi:hypothetical protein
VDGERSARKGRGPWLLAAGLSLALPPSVLLAFLQRLLLFIGQPGRTRERKEQGGKSREQGLAFADPTQIKGKRKGKKMDFDFVRRLFVQRRKRNEKGIKADVCRNFYGWGHTSLHKKVGVMFGFFSCFPLFSLFLENGSGVC